VFPSGLPLVLQPPSVLRLSCDNPLRYLPFRGFVLTSRLFSLSGITFCIAVDPFPSILRPRRDDHTSITRDANAGVWTAVGGLDATQFSWHGKLSVLACDEHANTTRTCCESPPAPITMQRWSRSAVVCTTTRRGLVRSRRNLLRHAQSLKSLAEAR